VVMAPRRPALAPERIEGDGVPLCPARRWFVRAGRAASGQVHPGEGQDWPAAGIAGRPAPGGDGAVALDGGP
jgi:hypothetical protein